MIVSGYLTDWLKAESFVVVAQPRVFVNDIDAEKCSSGPRRDPTIYPVEEAATDSRPGDASTDGQAVNEPGVNVRLPQSSGSSQTRSNPSRDHSTLQLGDMERLPRYSSCNLLSGKAVWPLLDPGRASYPEPRLLLEGPSTRSTSVVRAQAHNQVIDTHRHRNVRNCPEWLNR